MHASPNAARIRLDLAEITKKPRNYHSSFYRQLDKKKSQNNSWKNRCFRPKWILGYTTEAVVVYVVLKTQVYDGCDAQFVAPSRDIKKTFVYNKQVVARTIVLPAMARSISRLSIWFVLNLVFVQHACISTPMESLFLLFFVPYSEKAWSLLNVFRIVVSVIYTWYLCYEKKKKKAFPISWMVHDPILSKYVKQYWAVHSRPTALLLECRGWPSW